MAAKTLEALPPPEIISKKSSPLSKTKFRGAEASGLVRDDDEVIVQEEVDVLPSPLSRRRSQFTRSGKDEINNVLATSGLKQEEVIILKTGERPEELIKARTLMGQPVFVKVDTHTNPTAISRKDLTMMEVKEVSRKIPTAIKEGNLGCVKEGVVLECEGGICTLTKQPSRKSVEQNFLYVSRPAPEAGLLEDNPLGIPITKLSDWEANPAQTLVNTVKETHDIRKSARVRMREDLEKHKKTLVALAMEIDAIEKCLAENEARIFELMAVFEEKQKGWMAIEHCGQRSSTMEEIRTKLSHANDGLSEVLKSGMAAEQKLQHLEACKSHLEELRKHVCNTYTTTCGQLSKQKS